LRIFFAALLLLLYTALCLVCWWRYRRSLNKSEPVTMDADSWLIAYASQGGTAAQLAWQSADQLREAGVSAQVLPLNRMDEAMLGRQNKILFIVSTFGEGEAPDNGSRILARLANRDLRHLQYGLLALGDSHYRFFCAFGHRLQHALHAAGATELFDLIEVDQGDPAALRHWQYYLGQLSGQTHFRDWQPPDYEPWTLQRRICLNPGSPGTPAFWLQLMSVETGTSRFAGWRAGDIAEVGPRNGTARVTQFLRALGRDPDDDVLAEELRCRELPEPFQVAQFMALDDEALLQKLPALPHREYSIASIPEAGSLELLVRQVQLPGGEFGLGSGWLTHHAELNTPIALRIRSNPGFHPPAADVPLILIGNGTGMAGLRAHLLARRQQGARRNWLLFGERTAAHDFFFGEEIRTLQDEGFLDRLSLAFSRDGGAGAARYVQDLLAPQADRLREWVAEGAAIYVCGSLNGMAQGVDAALTHIFGRDQLEVLVEARRYCRDVY
jgi:sulfite reductase (NADPH) flavoprotein alpha-component